MTRALPLPRRERPHTCQIRALAEGKKAKEREGKEEKGEQRKRGRLCVRASPKKQNTGARPVFWNNRVAPLIIEASQSGRLRRRRPRRCP